MLRGELLPFDDDLNIYLNPHLHGLGWEQLKWIIADTSYLRRYQPLCWLTWATINQFFGFRPLYYHLAVLLIHAVNTGLVFLLIKRLLCLSARHSQAEPARHISICAALAAAIWGLHPLRVETTAWAVELVYVQPLFFLLLSLLCYLGAFPPGGQPGYRRYWAALGLFTASLLSFPIALGGFVVFIALDIFPLKRLTWSPRGWGTDVARRAWLEKVPSAVAALLVAWLSWHVRSHISNQAAAVWAKPATLAQVGLFPRLTQACYIWAYYAWKPWVPLNLTPVPSQLIGFNPCGLPFVLSALFVVVLTGWLFSERGRWPWALALWLCHLGLLLPMLGLSEYPHCPSDRYSLVVTIGWSILLGGLFMKVWPHLQARRALTVVLAFLLPALGLISYRQTFVWQTSTALFEHILAHLPDEPRLLAGRVDFYNRLASAYWQHGDCVAAAKALRGAIRLCPDFARGYYQLGGILAAVGDPDAAKINFDQALRLDASLVLAFNDLGTAYARRGRLDQAVAQFQQALVLQPNDRSALQNLARALTVQGKTNEASRCLAKLKQ